MIFSTEQDIFVFKPDKYQPDHQNEGIKVIYKDPLDPTQYDMYPTSLGENDVKI